MDVPGKDTARLWEAGCRVISIADEYHSAQIHRDHCGAVSPFNHALALFDCDLALVEGHKDSSLPKVVMLDTDMQIVERIKNGSLTNVVALAGESAENTALLEFPYFQRDRVDEIASFVEQYLRKSAPPCHGLIMAGGESRRMGMDKACLHYQGIPQIVRAKTLLSHMCKNVNLSCRAVQAEPLSQLTNLSVIEDVFPYGGPMGGLLSAQKRYPDCAFLVLACDMPLIEETHLHALLTNRQPGCIATCFVNSATGAPEPLCAIWEPHSHQLLSLAAAFGEISLRRVMQSAHVHCLPIDSASIASINTPEEWAELVARTDKKMCTRSS